jgi:hypothetical protein
MDPPKENKVGEGQYEEKGNRKNVEERNDYETKSKLL